MARRIAALAAALLLLAAAAAGYLRSAAFQRRAEAFVLARIEQATGARVEIGAFHIDLLPLRLDLRRVTVRGRESEPLPPLAEIAEVRVGIRLISFLGRRFSLDDVTVSQPRIRIYLLPDAATNLPAPPLPSRPGALAQPLFDLGLRSLRLANGELDIEDQRVPLNLTLRGVALQWSAIAEHGGAAFRGALRYSQSDFMGWSTGGDLRFTLFPNALRVDNLELRDADGSRLAVTGLIPQLTAPSFTGRYQAQGGAAEWTRRLGLRGAPGGQIQSSGTLAWSPADWRIAGDVAGALEGDMEKWTVQAAVIADPDGLQITRLELRGIGAAATIHGQIAHWRSLDLAGRVAGVRLSSLPPLLRAVFPDPRWASSVVRVDGALAGAFQLQATLAGTPRLDQIEVNLNLAPTPAKRPGALPLGGHIVAHWTPSALELQQLALNLPASTLVASGRLRGADSALQVDLQTGNLAELRPWLLLAYPQIPPLLAGAGHVQAEVTGTPDQPHLNGSLEFAGLRYGDFTADRLSAAGALAPDQLVLARAALLDRGAQITASGRIGLFDYQLAGASRLDLQLQAARLDVARFQALAGLNYPVSGSLGLRAHLGGTRAAPEGDGSFQLLGARWEKQAVQSLAADFQLRGQQLSSDDFTLTLGRTRIAGRLRLGIGDHSYSLDLSSPNLDLGEIAALQSNRLPVAGALRFALSGSGTWERPQAHLALSTTGLRGGGETLGVVAATLDVARGAATFQATDTLPNGNLALGGTVSIAAPYPVQAHLALRDYDFDAWLRRFTPAQLSGHSRVSGAADIAGPLANPADLTARIALDPIEMAISGLVLTNQGPVQLLASAQELTLAPAHFVARDTDFQISGGIQLGRRLAAGGATLTNPLTDNARLSGALQGKINLALLQSLHPATRAAGELDAAARLAGSFAAPQFTGAVSIHNGSLAEEDFPIAFDTIEGQLALNGSRIQIQSLTANTGGGTVAFTGYAVDNPGGVSFDLNARGSNLRLRYQGISAAGDAQLRLNAQRGGALLSGEVQLNRLALDQDFDLAVLIANTQTSAPPDPDSLLAKVRMDVHLTTGPQVEVATNLAHMQLQGDLRLRGTLAEPELLGRASAAEGKVLFGGNQYQVDKAQVQFVNPFRIEPQLDVGLSTTVQQYDVTLNINGTVDKMNVTYRSDPPLSSTDIVALLATGQPTDASAGLNPGAASNFNGQSEQLLGAALNNVVQGRLQRLFGITQIQVDPNAGTMGTTGSGGTVTLQQQVSRDVKLTYTQNLASSSQDIVQIDWTISKLLGVTVSRDQFGLYGIKFTFRHRAK